MHVFMKLTGVILIALFSGCLNHSTSNDRAQNVSKINGVTFDGPSSPPITEDMVIPLKEINANWIATTPEAFTYHHTLEVKSFFKEGQWYGETIHGSQTVIELSKKLEFKIMLKPHIGLVHDMSGWNPPKNLDFSKEEDLKKYRESGKEYISKLERLTIGNWRGNFGVKNFSDWKIWESGYEKFILENARIADSAQVDLFCIGTELSISAVERESFWRNLISKVRHIYKGPITYSANWDNYQNIKFWNDLDYIGISAYFPLSEKDLPTEEDAMKAWEVYIKGMQDISDQYSKPILFTEFGYKSVEYAAREPWLDEGGDENASNEKIQADLYSAIFRTFWEKEWFAGGFIWKWYYSGNGGSKSFSPQNKMAEKKIKNWYLK